MNVDRALIIRRDGVELSQKYAAGCAKSCEEHNLPYEFIKAVEFLSCEEAYKSVGARLSNYTNGSGNCCIHSSMIKCWKRIVELQKTCIILEHDAIVLGDVTNINIPDNTVVTFGGHVLQIDEYKPVCPAFNLVRLTSAKGCHAYSITPVTAQNLLDDVDKHGIWVGVDKLLMLRPKRVVSDPRYRNLQLLMCEPPQVVAWNRLSTNKMENTNQVKAKFVNIKNPVSMMTKYWIKGLKKNHPDLWRISILTDR